MSSSIAQQLVAMGFAPETASAAAGNNRNIDQALTFIQVGGEGYDMDVGNRDLATAADVSAPAVAKGFMCDECGTSLLNDQAVMDHANQTKHSKFRQSTEEAASASAAASDEQAKIKEVFDKILAGQKKKEQENPKGEETEIQSRAESRALDVARQEQRERELKEYAEQRRRQKAEEDVQRKRVLEQIKLDQEERKEREARATAAKKTEVAVVKGGVEEGFTMLQIRMQDGKTVKQTFKANEPLLMVRAWIETNHPVSSTFKLMTPFPRKEFTEDDMGTTLKQLNLVPSANIVVINRTPDGPTQASAATPYRAPVFDKEEEEDSDLNSI